MTSASISNGTLFISGTSPTPYQYATVGISNNNGVLTVLNSDTVRQSVPISGNPDTVRNIDLSGLAGAGASVRFSYDGRNTIHGSGQADLIVSSGLGKKKVVGRGGNDALSGSVGGDHLIGGLGDDQIWGRGGRDRITGGKGNDSIEGGNGQDTLILAGKAADYELSIVRGRYQLAHSNGDGVDGVDTFVEIEKLQFSDRTVEINSDPTFLTAEVADGTLFVAGVSGTDETSEYVTITDLVDTFGVRDNARIYNNTAAEVDVKGDIYEVKNIDARGLTGAGAEINSEYLGANRVDGSNQDDLIRNYDTGNGDRIYGRKGNDRIFGFDGNDILFGGRGNDYLVGSGGDDRIRGQRGSDEIDGGDGVDTLVFRGDSSEYDINIVNGQYRISHLNGRGYDGIDYFYNIERLQFSDQVIEVSNVPTLLKAQVSGDTLIVSGPSAQSEFPMIRVEIEHYSSVIEILDNHGRFDDRFQYLPIAGDVEGVRNIDVRGVTGGGVKIYSNSNTGVLLGSEQNDILTIGGGKSGAKLLGNGGDDYLGGGNGGDTLVGGSGDDRILGLGGRDRLKGQQGSDFFNGGGGIDTIIFKGTASEYELVALEGQGGFRISHSGGSGFDGVDEFHDIERLQFSDQTLTSDSWDILF